MKIFSKLITLVGICAAAGLIVMAIIAIIASGQRANAGQQAAVTAWVFQYGDLDGPQAIATSPPFQTQAECQSAFSTQVPHFEARVLAVKGVSSGWAYADDPIYGECYPVYVTATEQ